jgi:hypothetical protein
MPGFFSGESLSGVDEPYRYFFRILFRTGTIAGNILFGLAFFMVARKMSSSKLRDYLILTGIGDTIVGIALSTSYPRICSASDFTFQQYLYHRIVH